MSKLIKLYIITCTVFCISIKNKIKWTQLIKNAYKSKQLDSHIPICVQNVFINHAKYKRKDYMYGGFHAIAISNLLRSFDSCQPFAGSHFKHQLAIFKIKTF